MGLCRSSYPILRLGPYVGRWRQAASATPAWEPMDWIIAVPLLVIAFACAYVPVLMD